MKSLRDLRQLELGGQNPILRTEVKMHTDPWGLSALATVTRILNC